MAELKTLAQGKTRALNWGTLGAGSAPELFLRWINNQWGTDIVGIPYRGGGPMAQALAASEIQVAGVGLGNFLGSGRRRQDQADRGLGAARSPLVPDVMTFDEAGLGGYPQRGWWGLAAPAGTPKPIVDRLNAEFVRLFSDPNFVAFLDKQAVVSAPTSPQVRRLREARPPACGGAVQAREHAAEGIQAGATSGGEVTPLRMRCAAPAARRAAAGRQRISAGPLGF